MKALVALADGTVFEGQSVGAIGESVGELVFNTSMTGYQEILTDPSYAGQMVTMTYPLIGNYGVNPEDEESDRPQVRGFLMKECCRRPSNWRATGTLPDYLAEHGVIGVEGIDTRELTRRVRIHGVMNAVLSTEDLEPASLVQKARAWEGLEGADMAQQVSCQTAYEVAPEQPRFHVVAFDFGIKRNIIRKLVEVVCRVTVVPATTTADAVLAMYHDQGLIPFKTLSFGNGVNFTAGLSLIRTSPDHGTAFDIAGKGIANFNSFKAALLESIKIFKFRNHFK